MRERELRRRCRKLLNELDIRPPLDVHELCRRVGTQRGKPIRAVAHSIPMPGPFGAWITTNNADYILYQQATSRAHQDHIVLHELGHILAGHRSEEDDDSLLGGLGSHDQASSQFPDLAPDAVRRALHRTSYDSEQEREAETVATIILEWASVLASVGPPPASSDATAERMGNALTDRLGWL
jgi:hypothetical protein